MGSGAMHITTGAHVRLLSRCTAAVRCAPARCEVRWGVVSLVFWMRVATSTCDQSDGPQILAANLLMSRGHQILATNIAPDRWPRIPGHRSSAICPQSSFVRCRRTRRWRRAQQRRARLQSSHGRRSTRAHATRKATRGAQARGTSQWQRDSLVTLPRSTLRPSRGAVRSRADLAAASNRQKATANFSPAYCASIACDALSTCPVAT